MKLLMIWGGLIGFAIGILAGLVQGCDWPNLFWRASVAALLAGVVLRWWGRVWMHSLDASLRERAQQAAQNAAAPVATQAKA